MVELVKLENNKIMFLDTILVKDSIEAAIHNLREHEIQYTVRFVTRVVSKDFGKQVPI